MSAKARFSMYPKHDQAGTLTFGALNDLVEFKAAFELEDGRTPFEIGILDSGLHTFAIVLGQFVSQSLVVPHNFGQKQARINRY